MDFIKRVWAAIQRKAGVSSTGSILPCLSHKEQFKLYREGKRTALIVRNTAANIGDIIVLREFDREQQGYTGREIHFFVHDILEHDSGLKLGYQVLTLK